MIKSDLILIILILSISFKAIGDAYSYRFNSNYNKSKTKKYGYIYHILYLLSVITPLMLLTIQATIKEQLFVIAGFLCLYSFLTSWLYNMFSGHNSLYIGKTDGTDVILRKLFRLNSLESDAKKQQLTNFKKVVVFAIRFILFGLGIFLIQNYG